VRRERRAGRADQGAQPLGGHHLRRVPGHPRPGAQVGQIVANVPGPVIGGAATVMFAMVTAVGIRTLNKASVENNNNLLILAGSLSAGLIPAVAPSFYERFPSNFQVIFGSSITSTVIVVFVLNLVFNHWSWRQPKR